MELPLIGWIGIMILSMAVLVKAADYFTTYSEKIGLILGISPFVIGATIVGVGTSMPELITSIISVYKGEPGIVSGNVVGSNITNILLIIGVGAIISKNTLSNKKLDENLDIPILAFITIFLLLMLRDGTFGFTEGIIMIVAYVIYTAYLIHDHRTEKAIEAKVKEDTAEKSKIKWHLPVIIIVSGFFIYIGAEWTIESVIKISEMLNIGTAIIAGTVVALGTSLPELVVSIQAARRKQAGMILGNIFGSNIFNSTIVMGVPALMTDLPVPAPVLAVGIPFLIGATMLLIYSSMSKHISSFEGALYVLMYSYFIIEFVST
ncbi:conjugal transfer protein TraR [Candidatus Peregrinibacteria bacterium CG22_combo_CG10-13_8_21_14_all_44_10]|nr:MAG: hypothetical protein AUK45_01765 [Candidatus Peregrinibacteria bacterium CG2_30_44_17]PIP66042.1 MAG: conjugal transfer protein TraR [Candidatus Peregrinibacteria bacterium CG22_combo_CG10-13_8_21_14_all_44_10]PIS04111.1 MAG: conjugal transfer protein TraR [Candidatus Peregrinibacteria bacterium CG10_big_fil_rev_8_21_14_0_10_44_7]PIX80241.1 MAG: conjugal transfer protein TraR [Candidatus Peregrinibacteria bacterium CG_4_10_14_3_um_filter_44_21]PJB88845.1 MAG: conjugal transfer protein T